MIASGDGNEAKLQRRLGVDTGRYGSNPSEVFVSHSALRGGSGWVSRRTLLAASGALVVSGCASASPPAPGGVSHDPDASAEPTPSATSPTEQAPTRQPTPEETPDAPPTPTRDEVVEEFQGRKPKDFGMFVRGVVTRGKAHVALTFDACGGGKRGNGFDAALIKTLTKNSIPATLFLNARWIASNPTIAADLAANPLFELANHGFDHVPLTVAGQKAYGIAGTASVGAAYDEIVRGQDALAEITGMRSPFFRPGTAWVDDVGVAIANRLGVRIIAFNINVDAGASASAKAVASELRSVKDRSITLAHFNRPESETAEGLTSALPHLLGSGHRFVTLDEALG